MKEQIARLLPFPTYKRRIGGMMLQKGYVLLTSIKGCIISHTERTSF